MSSNRIFLSLAQMGGHELEFIQQAFDTNWVAPLGPNVDAFQKDLQRFLSTPSKEVVALSAGTAAIHLALVLLGVHPGDEVICQSFTFSASANPIAYQGATPVFVDSELNTWNMSPHHLRTAIEQRIKNTGKKPKAILPVHLYGMPAEMNAIVAVATEYNIPIVEDAAEALGSTYKGQKCGTFGLYGALSFNGNKMITTSGGGALICPTLEDAKRAIFFATQARDQAPHYQHSHIGYNYRLSNISAGIGRGQMLVLADHIKRRREINELYRTLLTDIPGIVVHTNPTPDYQSNHWLTCVIIEPKDAGFTREDLRLRLEAENIESRPLWKPLHLQPVFATSPYYGSNTAEQLFDKGLCLPSGSGLSNADIERVVSVILKLLRDRCKKNLR